MAEFIYQEPFPVGEDKTKYRLLTKEYVKVVECDGRKILKVDPAGLELLSKAAYSDVSFYLRAAHLKKLGFIVTDSAANFLFVSHPDVPAKELLDGLRQRGILVRWWDKPRIRDYLRITVGTDQEMQALCAAMAELVGGK